LVDLTAQNGRIENAETNEPVLFDP
jgi:hypothetical protein